MTFNPSLQVDHVCGNDGRFRVGNGTALSAPSANDLCCRNSGTDFLLGEMVQGNALAIAAHSGVGIILDSVVDELVPDNWYLATVRGSFKGLGAAKAGYLGLFEYTSSATDFVTVGASPNVNIISPVRDRD